ncbi:MAG: acyltransferase [Hyphomicrobiales bacterium]|nr:acyltransferase [Hyphomicrobiales bacterium]
MAQGSSSYRYLALDGYRFIAAGLVALHHYDLDFRLGLDRLSPIFGRLPLMVDFFFLLSGFVIATSYAERMANGADYGHFLKARLARLYPLHLLTLAAMLCMVGIAVAAGVKINHADMFDLRGLPANLLLLHAWGGLDHLTFVGPSWSISAEWFVYLLAPLFFLAARRLPLFVNVVLLAATVSAMALVRARLGLPHWWDTSYDFGALRAVPTFFAGVLIAMNLHRLQGVAPPWGVVHAVFIAALAGLALGAPAEAVIALFGLLTLSAALATRGGALTLMAAPAITRAGNASYAFYLTQSVVATPVLAVLRKTGLLGAPVAFAGALFCLLATYALSLFLYRRFEKPAQKWILALGAGSPAAKTPGLAPRL